MMKKKTRRILLALGILAAIFVSFIGIYQTNIKANVAKPEFVEKYTEITESKEIIEGSSYSESNNDTKNSNYEVSKTMKLPEEMVK